MWKENYEIVRIINNNVITSFDDKGQEIVLMGKGIAYLKKVGDNIHKEDIEKVFILKDEEKKRYLDVIEAIDAQYFDIALEILEYVEYQLRIKANPIGYIMLADHIASAVERTKKGILIKNEMMGEIKTYFPKEFEVGKSALLLLRDELGVDLPEDEAGFIAFNIINMSDGTKNEERTVFIEKVVEIVENYFRLSFNRESFHYERFITHLKYFFSRMLKGVNDIEDGDDFLYRMLKIQYPEIEKCVNIIQEFIQFNYKISITNEEKGYLIVHINNLLMKSKMVTN